MLRRVVIYDVQFGVPFLLRQTSSGKAREKKSITYPEVIFDSLFQLHLVL